MAEKEISGTVLSLEKISIEEFRLYSTQSLKVFLSIRKKSTTGSFDTLVARYVHLVFTKLIFS